MVEDVSGPTVPSLSASYRADAGSISGRLPATSTRQWQANATSIVGVLLCVSAAALLALGGPIYAAALLFPLGGLCDLVDGILARAAMKSPTKVGAFIDSMCDKLGEVAILLGLAIFADSASVTFLALAALAFGFLTSYTKAVAGEHRIEIDWPEARTFGRAGRVILLSATLLLAAFAGDPDVVFTVGLAFLVGFNCVTFVWRLMRVAGALAADKQYH
jgi:phosphatidylinositol phosphate synthase